MTLVDCEVQTDECEYLLSDSKSGGEGVLRRARRPSEEDRGGEDNTNHQKGAWMRKSIKRCLYLLVFLTLLGCAGIFYFGYYCPDTLCGPAQWKPKFRVGFLKNGINQFHLATDRLGQPLSDTARASTGLSFDEVSAHDFQFDIRDHDVIVFLHVQKTGGTTFGRHLVDDLDLERSCQCHRKVKKRCTCLRPGPHSDETWLFSRHSTGWKCGLHADWTELTSCVDDMLDEIEDHEIKRRYFYITFLRNPIHRYLSEFRHVRRGATWKTARLLCQGKSATKDEVPLCYDGDTWENVTLEEFLACKSNLASNRQTRMLADLTLVGCYNTSLMSTEERESTILLSAKSNLKKMAFFGLTEFQENSQYLFEETFNLKFKVRFDQHNQTISDAALQDINPTTLDRIKELNRLDMQLYEYAKDLLAVRYNTLSSQDPHFKEHFDSMGRSTFSWDEIEP